MQHLTQPILITIVEDYLMKFIMLMYWRDSTVKPWAGCPYCASSQNASYAART